MSQLDEAILDALTHVTFPKGFAQAEPAWVVTVDGVDYPLWKTDATVVGSGAAGLRAAVELKRRQQNVLIATAGLYMGTSACSGSDKQTLFTAATAGNGDNFTKLAEALASGGAMDHDIAYVEAVGSLHTLGGLQYLGLELPEDRYGAILRYQTDHDEAGRATSCGPRTSRLMVKVLLEEVQRLAIPVLTSATVIKLLHQRDENGEDRVAGAILATGHRAHNPWGLAIVTAPNVVLATGGLASFIATVCTTQMFRLAGAGAGRRSDANQPDRKPVWYRHTAQHLSVEFVRHLCTGDPIYLFRGCWGQRV